jgi:hypothetical protein
MRSIDLLRKRAYWMAGPLRANLQFNWALMPSNVRLQSVLRHKPCQLLLAALERVPNIKTSDVEEVFFGNVLSAK